MTMKIYIKVHSFIHEWWKKNWEEKGWENSCMGNMGSIINRAVKSYWTVNNNEKLLKYASEYMRYEHLQPEAFYGDKINSYGST